MSRLGLFLRLSSKLALRGRLSLSLLLASVCLLSFIFVVSLSMLLSLQKDQIDVIRDVLDFDFQVSKTDEAERVLRDLKGVGGIYLCCDIAVFGGDSDSFLNKRFCPAELFDNSRFRSKFDRLPYAGPTSSFSFVSSFLPALKHGDSFYVAKGANGRANIFKDDFSRANLFSSSYAMLDGMAFENIFVSDGANGTSSPPENALKVDSFGSERFLNPKIRSAGDLFYGIYADDFNRVARQLRSSGIEYRTYMDISRSICSALMIERVLFFFILLFLLVILVALIYRLFIRFLAEDRRKAAILMILGMDRRQSLGVFSVPCAALTFVSIVFGSLMGCLFITRDGIRKSVFDFLFKSMSGMGFRVSYPFVCVFVLVSSCIVLAMHYAIFAKMSKTDVIGIVKSRGE